jgi:hypothetical protein
MIGGATDMEMAGAIAEWHARELARDFSNVNSASARVPHGKCARLMVRRHPARDAIELLHQLFALFRHF